MLNKETSPMTHSHPDGYLAHPSSGSGPGVLVLHAWWGLNDTIKGVCDLLAADGFTAFAPDLYHGRIATTIPVAEALGGALDENFRGAQAEIAAAAAFLQGQANGRALAILSFSLGAYYGLVLSNEAPDLIERVVLFYGLGFDTFSHARAAYLGHFAEHDPYVDAEEVAHLAEVLRAAGRPATFHTYPGTQHWFCEPDRPEYDPAAADLAWERTLAFLKS
jgi:carboxymethylenebutenolidase